MKHNIFCIVLLTINFSIFTMDPETGTIPDEFDTSNLMGRQHPETFINMINKSIEINNVPAMKKFLEQLKSHPPMPSEELNKIFSKLIKDLETALA